MSTELSELRRSNQEGLAKIAEACQEATLRVERLKLGTALPELEPNCQSLPLVAEFITKVAADVRSFNNKMDNQLVCDKHEASKLTATSVMAAFREANPGAVMPNFAASSPSEDSRQAVNAPATAIATKMFPRR